MTAGEVEASRLHGKMRAIQEKSRSASVKVPGDMLVVAALAEQSLHLKYEMTKWKQELVELDGNCKLQTVQRFLVCLSL